MTEFELIRRYFTHPARGATLGVGDDAALLRLSPRTELVVSADMLVEGRHFFAGADPQRLGHKALAVNLSDLAAMGAKPRWVTLALALPRADEKWLAGFSRGFMALAKRHSVSLVGGDTTRGPLNIAVQIMGEVPRGKALRRDGAKVGDDVWVSGYLGEAAMALDVLKGRNARKVSPADRKALEARLHEPTPRVALGTALRGTAHSAIDISDGLVADLGHICERSIVAAEIEWEAVPALPLVRAYAQTDRGARALLAGGDDYELCFTASPRQRAAVTAAAARARVHVTMVGRIVRKTGRAPLVLVRDSVGKPMSVPARGFDHFR
ncbi:MAG TPA: thiamine-phosphate kinase [Burkholderiales bacterium]|nr:thiamine-phosphate kinase [Burkholderiales bacterium]